MDPNAEETWRRYEEAKRRFESGYQLCGDHRGIYWRRPRHPAVQALLNLQHQPPISD